MIYVLRFGQWVKVGWTDCFPQRALKGFWDNKHPKTRHPDGTDDWGDLGLCFKLDDYEVIKLFEGGSKKFEEKLNKAVPGVGEFHLEVFSLPWILEALQHLEELPPPGKIECERPERKPCCGGPLHRCFACEPPREFAGKKHLVRHMANKKHRKL